MPKGLQEGGRWIKDKHDSMYVIQTCRTLAQEEQTTAQPQPALQMTTQDLGSGLWEGRGRGPPQPQDIPRSTSYDGTSPRLRVLKYPSTRTLNLHTKSAPGLLNHWPLPPAVHPQKVFLEAGHRGYPAWGRQVILRPGEGATQDF